MVCAMLFWGSIWARTDLQYPPDKKSWAFWAPAASSGCTGSGCPAGPGGWAVSASWYFWEGGGSSGSAGFSLCLNWAVQKYFEIFFAKAMEPCWEPPDNTEQWLSEATHWHPARLQKMWGKLSIRHWNQVINWLIDEDHAPKLRNTYQQFHAPMFQPISLQSLQPFWNGILLSFTLAWHWGQRTSGSSSYRG